MHVGIVEARQDAAPVQIDDLALRRGELADGRGGPDRQNPLPRDRDRLGFR